MLLSATQSTSDFKPTPPGQYMARCYRVIDLGTQETTWKGTAKHQRKLLISWEIHGEDEDGNPLVTEDGKPLISSKRFTASITEKAALRGFLESWRGKAFTGDELNRFDLKNMLGAWGMINITSEERDGKTYSNVDTIMPIPVALRKSLPTPVNTPAMYDMTRYTPDMDELFNSLGKGLRETIMKSPEWQALQSQQNTTSLDDLEDSIPF
jgi:hypothetical protein